jgi:hypothetical protein
LMNEMSDETLARAGLTLNQDGRESSGRRGGSREKAREFVPHCAQSRAGSE